MIHSQFYQSRFNSIDRGCWGFYSHSPTFPKVLTLSYLHVSYSFRFGATFLITCSLHFLRIMTSHVTSWLIICHSSFLFFFSCIFQFSKPSSLLQSPFKFTNFRPQSAFLSTLSSLPLQILLLFRKLDIITMAHFRRSFHYILGNFLALKQSFFSMLIINMKIYKVSQLNDPKDKYVVIKIL